MKVADFSSLLTRYLTHYLPVQRNLSSNTIRSYRDTFKLLLLFCRDVKKFNISRLAISMLDKKCIEEFLLWLTNIRGASASTYNQRLCAIHAFFDYVIAEEPGLMEQCVQVLDIPHKVTHAPPAHYLTPESLRLLLSMPDRSTRKGRRHLVLLTVLYDTAARVSELTDICLRDVRLEPPAVITPPRERRKNSFCAADETNGGALKRLFFREQHEFAYPSGYATILEFAQTEVDTLRCNIHSSKVR